MKRIMYRIVAVVLTLILVFSFVSCRTSTDDAAAPPTQTSSPDTTKPANGETVDNLPAPDGHFSKYDPPIELTAVRGIPAGSQEANFAENIWIDEIEDKLGIKIKYEWMVIGDQYEQRVNLMLASGNLPDTLSVNLRQLYQMQEAGQLQDIKAAWDQYATEQVKTVMTAGGSSSFDIATIDGSLYGIPAVVPTLETMHVLYVREDWRQKLNLPEPNTIKDMETIMYAFHEMDPNETGENDTFGLGLNKDLFTNGYEMRSLSNAFGAYPRAWIEDANGDLMYGGIVPEMKEALLKLQQYFKDGLIDREFTVKDQDKASEFVAKEQLGMFFGVQWASFIGDALPSLHRSNSEAEWTVYKIPDPVNGLTKPIVYDRTNRFLVVNANYEHPEAVVKINNYVHLMGLGPQGEGEFAKTKEEWGELWDRWGDGLFAPETVHGNTQRWQNTFEALRTGDTSEIDKNYLNDQMYQDMKNYFEGGRGMVNYRNDEVDPGLASVAHGWAMSGKNFMLAVGLNELGQIKYDKRGTFVSPTMIENQATLDKLELEIITRIITGDADVDEFDRFISQWQSLGGNQITQELNEWYKGMP